jgi:hypothetical protein
MSGLVIYAAYATCDPLLDGKIIARDQVSLDGNIITDGNQITNDQVSLDLIYQLDMNSLDGNIIV